jgi:hypothetical protein
MVLNSKKYISLDIDGVLNFYPDCWLEFLFLQAGVWYKTKEEAKNKLGLNNYKLYKDQYRRSEFKANLPVRNEWISIANQFVKSGFEVIISTSRPIMSEKYPLLYDLTWQWLMKNDLKFSSIIFKDESLTYHSHIKNEILFHVDDEVKYAQAFVENGIDTFLFSQNDQFGKMDDKIKLINTPQRILDYYESFL